MEKEKNPSLWEAVIQLKSYIIEGQDIPLYEELYTMKWEHSMELPQIKVPDTTCKIAFIICVNKEWYYDECCHYIKNLHIPKGYEIEIIPVRGAKNILSGYEQAMKSSDAQYKIYLHQDAMCVDPNLLYEAIHIFEVDNQVGILGIAGAHKIPTSGIWWEGNLNEAHYNIY